MRVLALDVGSKTIGLARGDTQHGVATPWETLMRRGSAADVVEIARRSVLERAVVLVVGMPLELDGRRGHRSRLVESFVRALERTLPPEITVTTWDERFSTSAAERSLLEADVSRSKRKMVIDAVAAQQILQSWLDAGAPGAIEVSRPRSAPPGPGQPSGTTAMSGTETERSAADLSGAAEQGATPE